MATWIGGVLKGIGSAVKGAAGSLLGAGAGLFGQSKNRKHQIRMQEAELEANRELAEYAYSKDLEMWERQNMYNRPEAQMERLKAAGLNPHLVYGTGAVGNTSGQMPQYNAPRANFRSVPIDVGGTVGQFQDLQLRQAQKNLLEERRNTEVQNSGLRLLQRNLTLKKSKREGLELAKAHAMFDDQLDFQRERVRKLRQDIRNQMTRDSVMKVSRDLNAYKLKMLREGILAPNQRFWIESTMRLLQDLGVNMTRTRRYLQR